MCPLTLHVVHATNTKCISCEITYMLPIVVRELWLIIYHIIISVTDFSSLYYIQMYNMYMYYIQKLSNCMYMYMQYLLIPFGNPYSHVLVSFSPILVAVQLSSLQLVYLQQQSSSVNYQSSKRRHKGERERERERDSNNTKTVTLLLHRVYMQC